jgi:hypothetical protein
MLAKRIACRAQGECAQFMKRHFSKVGVYGWPCYMHQMDLPTKNNRVNKKIKIMKPDEHLIVIALLEYAYMLNPAYNPGDSVFNKPKWHQHHRDIEPPHFKADPYAGSTIGNWTQEKILQHVKNYHNVATHAYKTEQIYPGGSHNYLSKGTFALSNSSFRKGNHQAMRMMAFPNS